MLLSPRWRSVADESMKLDEMLVLFDCDLRSSCAVHGAGSCVVI